MIRALLISGAVAVTALAAAQTYDFTSAFNLSSNPNGVWTYGYTTSVAGTFNVYTNSTTSGGVSIWYTPGLSGDNTPSAFLNQSGSTINGVANGEAGLHSGPSGQLSVARFTAPTANSFTISGKFGAGDVGTVDVYILKNGATLFSALNSSTDQTFNLSQTIAVGDTIDFVVGPAGGNPFDSTPLTATISSVPEPATIAFLGLGVAALLRRKRR